MKTTKQKNIDGTDILENIKNSNIKTTFWR